MIDEQAAAERLAREIVAELGLYNWKMIKDAPNLRVALMDDLLEGREVFRARVVPAMYPVFDAAVAAWLAEHGQPVDPGNDVLPNLVPALHEPMREAPREEPREEPFLRPLAASYLLPRARQRSSERAMKQMRPFIIAVCAFFALVLVLTVVWELRSY